MNYEPDRLLELVTTLKGARTNRAFANMLDVTEKTVGDWLKRGRISDDNIAKIEQCAGRHGIEPALFQKPRLIWDLRRTYDENHDTPLPEPPQINTSSEAISTILGKPVTGIVGASASVLTSHAGLIRYLSALGYDIIVYKTVRSRPYKAHPAPNTFVCDDSRVLVPDSDVPPFHVVDIENARRPFFALMNRFGMPSAPPEQWTADFRAASQFVRHGQLLIISVTGTASKNEPAAVLIDDFIAVAEMAARAGAEVIELNLSCPNCSGREGEVFRDLPTSVTICRSVRAALPQVKILVKLGYMSNADLERFVHATAPHVDGYSAINSIPVEGVRDGQDETVPAFGEKGLKAGLSGKPILRCGLAVVNELARLRVAAGANFAILASGGVTEPNDILTYVKSGADAVLMATAIFTDPLLALKARPLLQPFLNALSDRADAVELARYNWSRAMGSLEEYLQDAGRALSATEVFDEWAATRRANPLLAARGQGTGARVPTMSEFRQRILERISRRR
jgi:dihydroorotate dehydrogenase (NAD+) catalytic subunit